MRFLAFLLLLLPSALAVAGDALLTCTPPTTNTDGTALKDLAGYRFFSGTSPTTLTQFVQRSTPADCSATATGLAAGTWYFGVKAYTTSGVESAMSNVASKVIERAPPTAPVLVVVSPQAMSVKADWEKLAFVPSLEVGQVPLGAPCDPLKLVGDGFYAVDRNLVSWSGANRPANVVAKCSLQ